MAANSILKFLYCHQQSAPLAQASPIQAAEDGRVLIADSNPIDLALLNRLTLDWGMKPMAVVSGSEAWAVFQESSREKGRFFAALLNMDMRDRSGLELAKLFHSSATPPARIILMLSSPLQGKDNRDCKLLGITTIVKPVRRKTLYQALGERRTALVEPPTSTFGDAQLSAGRSADPACGR